MELPTTKEFEIPLHLQLALRKAELEAQEMTWDELQYALLALYRQRLLEIQAIKDMLQDENIELEFDIPTNLELAHLAALCGDEYEDDEDDDEDSGRLLPF